METPKEPRFRRTLTTLRAPASSRSYAVSRLAEGPPETAHGSPSGRSPRAGPPASGGSISAPCAHRAEARRRRGEQGLWHPARGSLRLLWVGSRDLRKICLLQCGMSSTPLLDRAQEGDVRSESTASCRSHHIPSFPFQMRQKEVSLQRPQ